MTSCERCGHECDPHPDFEHSCIANLRADCTAANAERDQAIHGQARAEELARQLEREHGNRNVIEAERLAVILRLEKDLEAERARSAKLTADIETGRCCDDYERLSECGHPRCVVSEICEICHELGVLTHEAEERAARAEVQCAAMRAAVEGLRRRSDYFERPGCFCAEWVVERPSEEHKPACVALTNALATDAGRDLLMAVRRLMEAAHMVLHEDIHEERSYGALDAALADPALTALQGTGPEVARDDSDRKRD